MSECYFRYEKTESARYVSHLDFVRMFGRAIRRAKIPIAYSEGFNPHPQIGFALPLSVGYTSECELMEISLAESFPPQEIMDRLNETLPQGVRILSAHEGKSNMKKTDNALYRVRMENLPDKEQIERFLEQERIVTEKKTKSGIKQADIRADIKSITVKEDCLEAVLSAGSRSNLKPDVLINALNEYTDGYNSGEYDCHRVAIYDCDMNLI